MGNKLCKKKSQDAVDNASKSPSQFDRIINRFHIRPNSWKSDPQLNQKQVKRLEKIPNEKQNNVITTKPLSKSSDWTEVDLEVPDNEDHPIHLHNPKLNLIFNNDKGTPTPPPRKHKKNLREKIEAVAKTGLQAFQSKKSQVEATPPKPPTEVEEPLFVKKTIDYRCPICDADEASFNRDHHHHHHHEHNHVNDKNDNKTDKFINLRDGKESLKRKKTLSVYSLPNYDELKLTVSEFKDDNKGPSSLKTDKKGHPSEISLPVDHKKTATGSTGKLDTYITRCRSFGSIFPQQLKKLRPRKAPTDIESDDSFGGLEDWDLGLIEHYNPKDASLPRPRKPVVNDDSVLAGLEGMIVTEEEIEKLTPKPKPRRAESLVKKINREAAEEACKRNNELIKSTNTPATQPHSITPPSSPIQEPVMRKPISHVPKEEDSKIEHSSLIKILEKFSMADKQIKDKNENTVPRHIDSNESSLTPSLVEFEKNLANSIEEYVKVENASEKLDDNKVRSEDKNINSAIMT
ncbi:uncharacterized protein LOC126890389 isoform X1 [Diabrotica virgifera virgifera]|uniref:Uncharacterized protein n=1 Tax=Diabrotica virgifera virgifera TaxID=50390 RepID=A0ABM5KYI0_DIAVI|nr:uncharacterized protein LOC126890389 isoform X1 [Diabrotica virgifera virgifera]